MFKGVIFDLDGVITDTAEYHYLAWQALGEKIGITFDRAFNENLKGVDRMESLRRILALGGKENDYSNEEKEALATEKNDLYQTFIDKVTPADLLPGIPKLLNDLQDHKIAIGLASASKNAPKILKNLGILAEFDTIVDPASLKHGKPAPDIFIQAAKQLNLEIKDAIGVEDAYSGIESIKAAHMFAVGVGDAETLKKADYVVSSTKDLTYDLLVKIWK
ncbi:beta-phosphoglucomutase [Enterococcus timonensis]|uniref:beta-phosphoglucomutase n=1 Tax=Enterococcus timonensis TaxID=1852364 RepID=UPI0008D9B89B|nr:beta-phosphoglucomutase [Enterococcus timonensis]